MFKWLHSKGCSISWSKEWAPEKCKKSLRGERKIIEGFKRRIFPFDFDEAFEEQVRHEEKEENIRNKNGLIY